MKATFRSKLEPTPKEARRAQREKVRMRSEIVEAMRGLQKIVGAGGKGKKRNIHHGSTLGSFLKEEGTLKRGQVNKKKL